MILPKALVLWDERFGKNNSKSYYILLPHITYYSLMFFIAYAFKGQVHVFAGQVNIVSHSSCRTSTILKHFSPLLGKIRLHMKYLALFISLLACSNFHPLLITFANSVDPYQDLLKFVLIWIKKHFTANSQQITKKHAKLQRIQTR